VNGPAGPAGKGCPDGVLAGEALPRLLLLEDDPYDAELELSELDRHGLTFSAVSVVCTEADFLAGIQTFRPDVILADYRLPGMSGERALDLALARCPHVPFVFVSGALGEDRAVELMRRGAWDYVLKDRPSRLGPAVSRSLADARERRRLEAERAEALEQLRASEERFRLAFEETLTGVALIDIGDCSGRFLRVNRALREFFGRRADALLETTLCEVSHPEDAPELRSALDDLIAGRIPRHRVEQRFSHADGKPLWAVVSVSIVRDDTARPLYGLAAVQDVTARKDAEEELAFRALHDDLTGLPNRALLLDHLRAALARAQRTTTQVAVLFIDLDDFKSVNDSFGHEAGDRFLVKVADRIASSRRETDTAARIGGDEFVVVCEDLTGPGVATMIADRIHSALACGIPIGGRTVGAPVSIGIAISDGRATPESLLCDADSAMYTAKRRGGRRWQPADTFAHTAAHRMLALEGEVREAVRFGQLRLHYQPAFDLQTRRMVGVEALLRWHHPSRGLLLPQELIEVAERRNLIVPIGRWVLQTACSQAAAWTRRLGPDAPVVAVNISSRQLGDRLHHEVRRLLRRYGLPPEKLCLELTESQVLSVGSSATADLSELSQTGVAIAVDDFGTGFSGFDYLRRLPVHTIKIDKSYVDGLGHDETDSAIVASVITLARSLDLVAVAEGIETVEQYHLLRDLGCPVGQGWLWYPALPAAQLEGLIRTTSRPGGGGTPQPGPPQVGQGVGGGA
jgi:diguanylate cyclase (GGDEF)-like protein/PAS domain S-box-containing protein